MFIYKFFFVKETEKYIEYTHPFSDYMLQKVIVYKDMDDNFKHKVITEEFNDIKISFLTKNEINDILEKINHSFNK